MEILNIFEQRQACISQNKLLQACITKYWRTASFTYDIKEYVSNYPIIIKDLNM